MKQLQLKQKKNNNMSNPTFNSKPNTMHHSKEDGKPRWHSRSCAVVAHVIFIDDNNDAFYLVGKRGNVTDSPNMFNLPCGYFDWDEDLQGAMFREVWEETGLDLNLNHGEVLHTSYDQPWYVNTNPNQNRQNVSFHAGLVIKMHEGADLPTLSLDNMEKDEATLAAFMPVEMLKAIPHSEWAFNHDCRVDDFLNFLGIIYIK